MINQRQNNLNDIVTGAIEDSALDSAQYNQFKEYASRVREHASGYMKLAMALALATFIAVYSSSCATGNGGSAGPSNNNGTDNISIDTGDTNGSGPAVDSGPGVTQ